LLQEWSIDSTGAARLVSLFPSLHSLRLSCISLGRGELLSELSTCTQLTRLSLISCSLESGQAIKSASLALKELGGLRELEVHDKPPEVGPVAGFDELMRLAQGLDPTEVHELIGICFSQPLVQLRSLSLSPARVSLSRYLLPTLLTSCSQLKDLHLMCDLDQQGLDAVLTHGSHLTSLCCGRISFSTSTVAAPVCNLKSFSLQTQVFQSGPSG
jgi:hypothetical protein